ncbi:hypothetical protein MMC17_008050 [Xylographa soralifera]|nr:hypothetical protein [Xylographa soralifera]
MNSTSDPFPPSLPCLDSPPFFDADMIGTTSNEDLYFGGALSQDSPGRFFNDDAFAASPFQSPAPKRASNPPIKGANATTDNHLSGSPESSLQDSSSDSSRRHKRRTSSKSSLSALTAHDQVMTGTHSSEWKSDDIMEMAPEPVFDFAGAAAPIYNGYDFSNRAMETDFDFESAASSPSPAISTSTPVHHTTRHIAIPYRASSSSAASLVPCSYGSPLVDTRETSPVSTVIKNESQPSKLQHSQPSPASSNEEYIGAAMVNGMEQLSTWPYESRAPPTTFQALPHFPGALENGTNGSVMSPMKSFSLSRSKLATPPTLVIHPTPHKSRVETQIPIKMTLCPMPQGITKLHLPPHTISKPKLLAKDRLPRAPDMLELYTMLVCTSAMQDPAKMRRAFARAAQGSVEVKKPIPRRSSSGDTAAILDEEDQPLNGGPVQICEGCILRERKRAARKKSKKPEEEEPWQKDEAKRIVVFNTSEVKEWQMPSDNNDTSDLIEGGQQAGFAPSENAKQIDVPMRIACYCRHQNEKLGFQVIFTLKDHEDNLVAQAITNPIVITDDHKTHVPPATLPLPSTIFPDHPVLPGGGMFGREPLENYGAPLFRNAHSTTDLQNMQHNPQFLPQTITPYAIPQNPSHVTGTNGTPRSLSRQASPSSQQGPMHKKRKASGSGKIPHGLTMTRIQNSAGPNVPSQGWTAAASSNPVSPAIIPSYAPSFSSYNNGYERSYAPASSSRPLQLNTGPPTPNSSDQGFFSAANRSQSLENLSAVQHMFSAPSSARPSRAASPVSSHQISNITPSGQGTTSANAMQGPGNAVGPQRPPTIHKLIPNEGSKAGGIEVTCLGSGFRQGLEVMFGDSLATTTTYWGETSIVCLLPPAVRAGIVAVTFKHQHQQQMQHARYPSPPIAKQQVFFKYVDDDEQELVRHALLLVHQKMTGTIEDVGEIARRIINAQPHGAGSWGRNGQQGGDHGRQVTSLQTSLAGTADTESAVLKCLDLIDLDDSPFQAHLNLRRPNGQSILHLSASLGYHRLVAGLLARGANPDLRDRNGMSPMHMAALHGHSPIVRRLRLAGGDPTLRSLRGYTPADMATSPTVLDAIQAMQYHGRSQSAGASTVSLRSQASSTTSLRSLWEPNPTGPSFYLEGSSIDDSDDETADEVVLSVSGSRGRRTPGQLWAQSRRNSTITERSPVVEGALQPLAETPGLLFPAAAMAAWRDQLAAQIQYFHQSVNWTLPNLQIPTLPPMPNLPDYRTDAMVRRFSSLVPQRSSRPSTSGGSQANKESDYRWWELLTGTASSPPPYEEIYPSTAQNAFETKISSAARATLDALADQKYNTATASIRNQKSVEVAGGKQDSTSQHQEQLRDAHERKIKRLRSDRNLFFIWIPLLLFVVMAMLKDRVPQVWHGAQQAITFAQHRYQERLVEVL